MNYLSLPRQAHHPSISSLQETTETFFKKDSFLQNSQQNLQSYKYLPQTESVHPRSQVFISFPQERSNLRKQFEELKETVAEFKKSLEQPKYGQERTITQKTQISYVIRTLFSSLKEIIKSNRNSQDFQWVFEQYIYVLRRKENYQHFFTQVSGHLKQILGSSELIKLRKNRKIFIFLSRIFPYCPHTVHKILMNKAQIFENEVSKQAIQVYRQFVKFTAEKSNSAVLLSWIKNEISKENTSIEKLTVLLANYKEKLTLEMIELIERKIDELIQNFLKYDKDTPGVEKQLINLIDQFLEMDWSPEAKKQMTIIKYINCWSKEANSETENYLNCFLKNMPSLVEVKDNKDPKESKESKQFSASFSQIRDVLYSYIQNRLLMVKTKSQKHNQHKKPVHKDFNQIFIFLTILFDRCGKKATENLIQKSFFKKTIINVISEDFSLKEGLINMLSTLKKLNVWEEGNTIQTLLIDKMITILSDEKGTSAHRYSQIFQKEIKKMQHTAEKKTSNDLLYCIKALRYFSFNYESFWNIYSMIKRYIFKKKIINLYGHEFRRQVIKSCLYIIEKLERAQECKNILMDALNIIGQDESLKTLYIKWVNQNNQFYDKKLFEVYNTPEGLEDLIHDYTSKDIDIKRFSIKMLCLLYPYNQCEIIPFLKKTYYQIYQRLSINELVDLNEKKIGLRLIRQIIKQRSQIVKDDSTQFASFLYNELCQIIKHNYHHHTHTVQRNQLIVEILKTIISLVKIMKECILPYVRTLGFHLLSLINSKVTSPEIKKYCLETFKEMTFCCGYVILPYFYHRNLLLMFRQIIKTDDRNHTYRNSLMKLMGSLGYVSKEKFFRLKRLTDSVQQGGLCSPQCYSLVELHFQKTFKEINYLKQIKLLQKPSRQLKDSRDLKQKDSKESREFIHIKELRQSKFSIPQSREEKDWKEFKQCRQIRQIRPFPATAPYYTEEKVNYKVSNENFNYKKMIIEKVLQNMNQQSSSIIFYNTFKTLESFIFVLPKSDQSMYQDLIFSKILFQNNDSQSKEKNSINKININQNEGQNIQSLKVSLQSQNYPLNNVLSLLVKIIFYQDFKEYIHELFNFFLTHINNEEKRTMILECIYVVTSRDSEFIKFDIKDFLLKIRKRILDLHKLFELTQNQQFVNSPINFYEVKQQILVCFGILANLSKYLDNYLHLFLPDFNKIFINQPKEICETYFCLLMKFFQNCPSAQQFLSEISDRMLDLLISQFQNIKNSPRQENTSLSVLVTNRPRGSYRTASISFINNIIDFLISILLIFGDKIKGFSERFHLTIRQYNYRSHMFYSIVQDFMKKSSSFHNLHYFFQRNELNEIMKFQKMHITLKTQEDAIIKNVYKHESVLNFNILNEMIENFNCDENEVEEQSEEWFVMLSINIFEKSEDPFTRACLPIVKEDKTLCNDLFPMAFYFFWNVLNNQFRRRLTMKLKNILQNKGISLKVKQKFIDTIYFMEQQKFPIPIADKILRDASEQVLDLAKSLFYMEKLFLDEPESHSQSLIKMYTEMGETESAMGLLKIVQNLTIRSKIELYQKLNQYHEAIKEYQNLKDKSKLENIELDIKIKKDKLEWDAIFNKCEKTNQYKKALSHYAVESAINLGKWDSAKKSLSYVEQTHEKYNFWKAILCLNQKKYDDVSKYIKKDRELIYPKICQLFNFSYERKMEGIIRLQILTELEEANEYLKMQKNTGSSEQERKRNNFLAQKKKALIESVWNDRIEGANTNLWSLQQLMLSRSLLFSRTDDIENWINFSRLAFKQNQPQLAKKTLDNLQKQIQDPKYVSLLKEQKDKRKHEFIIETLLVQCEFMIGNLKDEEAVAQIQKLIQEKGTSGSHHEYFYKCAMWLSQKQFDFTIEKAKKSILLLNKAVTDFKTYIKGWHFLGLMHNRVLQILETSKRKNITNTMNTKTSERRISTVLSSSKEIEESDLQNLNTTKNQKDKDSREHDSKQLIKDGKQFKDSREFYVTQALRCFIESVKCGVKNHQYFLQDCLKIMNIIFTEHDVEGVVTDILEEYEHIPPEGLIEIIPQIVGRLDISDKPILLEIMKKLLVHIGVAHPQAIIFPLIFCRKSGNLTKKKAADEIFIEIAKKQRSFYEKLEKENSVSQILKDAQKIAEQLIKVSLKLKQKFYINVNKIYRSSVAKGACSRQIAAAQITFISKILQDESSLTFSEYGFVQQYGQQLRDIKRKLLGYLDFNENQLFKKAEENIKTILDEISIELKTVNNNSSLEQVSPELYNIKQSKVCLFGYYNPASDPIYITSFKNQLTIIPSKQRPKKIVVKGSDEKDYNFLLKGKEDLRLDERIMQLFSLINKMFYDPSERENYSIKGYSITPISMEIGIISWVENCDTIGQLITKGRSSTKIYLEKEISRSICPVYDILPTAQKVEIYKEIQQKVSGTDLKNILWTRSTNSQEWLKSRTCFIRSLAVMSIVGYIIGLGDRHPNNIMIQRDTGQIVHIDFGDCFDVTKMRKEFPEKVPFRLTRMLVKAMEPCGVHGIFKQTCDKMMKLLRNNKESIITIVQAFRYDPLIGWRLVKNGQGNEAEGMLEHSYDDNDISFLTRAGDKILGEDKPRKEQKKVNRNIDFGLHILNEIKKKLNGRVFDDSTKVATPEDQVTKLINEAISPENLVEHYEGWQIYW